eukprot:Transcript_11479.p2 GENE.Transcript_11479~~Transcript_11479.p2  ORF type:complete len:220 (-),score=70.16 Transcript_11479:481-1140(-)
MPRQDRLPRLSVNTAAAPPPSGITVSATGSLRGDGISVSMAGLRIADAPAPSSEEAGSSSEGGAILRSLDVVRVLGEGSSGVVKLVRHRTKEQRYALKVIALGCAEQERKQILIELRTLHKCDSPNIVAFHDAFYAEGAVHVLLEYMDCGSLADVLARHGPLPERLLSKISQTAGWKRRLRCFTPSARSARLVPLSTQAAPFHPVAQAAERLGSLPWPL